MQPDLRPFLFQVIPFVRHPSSTGISIQYPLHFEIRVNKHLDSVFWFIFSRQNLHHIRRGII
jgi:hypothetical protein